MVTPRKRPPCPPKYVRPIPQSPCIPAGRVIPFGGPASGLWPSAGRGQAPAAAAAAVVPTPTPSCVTADLFSDCFATCLGTIFDGSPPVCGWTFDHFNDTTGTVVFTPGAMTFTVPLGGAEPGSRKPLAVVPATLFDLTGQFTFTEFPGSSNTGQNFYEFDVWLPGPKYFLRVVLSDDSLVGVTIGQKPLAFSPVPFYLGGWTPNGGTHVVHFTVDAMGVPTLWVDGVDAGLIHTMDLLGPVTLTGDHIIFFFAWFDGFQPPNAAPVEKAFLASGVFPPDTVFCCS